MPLADYGAMTWSGIMFGIGALPANFYVALTTDAPGTGMDGTIIQSLEPLLTSNYNRQAIAVPSGWTQSDGGFVINANEVDFPTPTVDWGQLEYFALLDDPNAGNLWAYGALLEPQYAPAGYPVVLGEGALFLGLGNQLASIAE